VKFTSYLRQVGRNLKIARTKSGFKQVDVYERGGITYRHYQNIEAGRVNVTLETLFRLSRIYKVRMEDLVKND
jgi:transcriptional regulator with XRE-family HTH domain